MTATGQLLIARKWAILHEEMPKFLLSLLHSELDTQLKTLPRQLTQPMQEALVIELIFAFYQQQLWLDIPIVSDVLISSLRPRFSLSEEHFVRLVQHLKTIFLRWCPVQRPTHLAPNESEEMFLEKCLTAASSSHSEEELELELGFGKTLFENLLLIPWDAQEQSGTYVSPMHQTIARVARQTARKLSQCSFLYDVYRLQSLGLKTTGGHSVWWHYDFLRQAFRFLVELAIRGKVPIEDAGKWFHGEKKISVKEALTLLEQTGLMQSETSTRFPKTTSLIILQEGLELTSRAYVCQVAQQIPEEQFLKLPATLQAALIAEKADIVLNDWQNHCWLMQLPLPALEAWVARRFAAATGDVSTEDLWQYCTSPWRQRAFIQGLKNNGTAENNVAAFLQRVAKSKDSPLVTTAAAMKLLQLFPAAAAELISERDLVIGGYGEHKRTHATDRTPPPPSKAHP